MSQALRSIKQKFINFFLMYINFAGRASYESIICVCVCVREREREREKELHIILHCRSRAVDALDAQVSM